MKIKKLNNGISSIAHEAKLLVEKGSVFLSECTLDVHGYIKGNIKGKYIKKGTKGKIYVNLNSDVKFLGKEKLIKIKEDGITKKLMGIKFDIDEISVTG